jgi:MFS family permease
MPSWAGLPRVRRFRAGHSGNPLCHARAKSQAWRAKPGGWQAQASATGSRSKNLVLTAMIFAVSMTFIDQTIVSIAVPEIQRELGLTSTGVQWAVNAYLLSLAALFALGGRLADTIGPRRMVTIGVIMFAGASTLCGLTPKGSFAEAWIIVFRVLQGAGGAIMFPAALAIVVQTFPLRERGKALAAAGGCWTGSGPSGRWCWAACSPRSASGCGAGR